jgi:transcriptional regulator with XRE-family HTH domain
MPPKRQSKPRSVDHAALGKAVEQFIDEGTRMTYDTVSFDGGLSTEQVGAIARGVSNPTYSSLLKLCDGLHITLGKLMTRVDELRADQSRR